MDMRLDQSVVAKEPIQDEIRRRFEREAGSFDAIYRLERSPLSRWFNKTFRKAVFERYDITFREAGDLHGKTVLDIGCGSGVYAVDFARRGARRVLGIDFSGSMLELARGEAATHGVAGACEFRRADFTQADLKGERFDVVIAMGVFDYLPEPESFLKKMAELASQNGRLIASFPGHSIVRERARKLRYRFTRRGYVRFYDDGEVRALAARAGVGATRIVPIRSSGRCTGPMPPTR